MGSAWMVPSVVTGPERLQMRAMSNLTNFSGSVTEVISLQEQNINISSGESRNISDRHGVGLTLTMPSIRSRNPVMKKHHITKFFQTLNQARTVWDPRCKVKGLFGGYLNIKSMATKREQLENLLVNSNIDFLGLTETWLTYYLALIVMPGYDVFRKDRDHGRGGGVLLYVKSTIKCKQIECHRETH